MAKSSEVQLDLIFRALSDPTRRAILHDIAQGERTVGEVARPYAMSLAAISKHLNVLEAADLIEREKRGSFQVVHLRADAMKEADYWLRGYENFWNQRLDIMQALLEEENEKGEGNE